MLVRSLRSSFIVIAIDSCSFYLGVFFVFFLFFDFTAISDCVFNNKNNYSTRACWISNNCYHFGATIISSAPSLSANLRYQRAFMTLMVTQFFLKIAHLSFSMGPRGPRAHGLRPRLQLQAYKNKRRGGLGRQLSLQSRIMRSHMVVPK